MLGAPAGASGSRVQPIPTRMIRLVADGRRRDESPHLAAVESRSTAALTARSYTGTVREHRRCFRGTFVAFGRTKRAKNGSIA